MAAMKQKRKRSDFYEESSYEEVQPSRGQVLPFIFWLLTAPFVWTWRQLGRLTSAIFNLCKSIIIWTLRSTWRAIAWTCRTAWDATVWTVKAPFRAVGWVWQLIFGPPVRYSNPRYAEIHALIARRYRRRSRFITHLFAFILTNALFWIDLSFKEGYYSPDYPYSFRNSLLIFTTLWAVVLLFHFIRMRHGVEEDHVIEYAIEREREWEMMQRRDAYEPGFYVSEDRYARLSDEADAVEMRRVLDTPEKRKNRL